MLDQAIPKTIKLADYAPPPWHVERAALAFDLRPGQTKVTTTLQVQRNPGAAGGAPLRLDGQDQELVAVSLNGRTLGPDAYILNQDSLVLPGLPDAATVEIVSFIRPEDNTALEGLYRSSGVYCTQCEAEGFRKITYFPDRPDVMARFRVRIEADRESCPVLLSNGNWVAAGDAGEGRHWTLWDDPWPKPCYLFALVAGRLACVEDRFVTRSGRTVALRIYVEPGNERKCAHAMTSLKNCMRWDEEVYGLEYDLDIFNIVAVSDFNMGAMENKSLNIFNAKYILASPDTAVDADFLGIEAVVAHEYFHNWTGNRVTCRDWFQLSLKEGLTVFRDQQFSAAMHSPPVKRIQDVTRLRQVQFAEDAGPTAHPIRPDSYIEINNFYTATVYEKGAEVVRLYYRLLGQEGYRRGMDLYFRRHDGQAVTTDDFLAAMRDANPQAGIDWQSFALWYSQAGSPRVTGEGVYDPVACSYSLTLRQHIPPTPGQPDKRPMPIPIGFGLVGPDGQDKRLHLATKGETLAGGVAATPQPLIQAEGGALLLLSEQEQTFVFHHVEQRPTPSLLRDFSAPVKLAFSYDDADLAFLMRCDRDPFNRWEAGQTLAMRSLLAMVAARAAGQVPATSPLLVEAVGAAIGRAVEDPAFAALALTLPSENYLGQQMPVVDVDGIHVVRKAVRRTLGQAHADAWRQAYEGHKEAGPFSLAAAAIGRRAMKNVSLGYLMAAEADCAAGLALAQYKNATGMTDVMAALALIVESGMQESEACLEAFAHRWADEPLVMDKWLMLQAQSCGGDALARTQRLMAHPCFSLRNPNKVYALIGGFAGNPVAFHAANGAGYYFVAEQVIALNGFNPQVASRIAKAFARWRSYDEGRQGHARQALEMIVAAPGLSPDVFEIVTRSLGS
jgi:aminopeptidase N